MVGLRRVGFVCVGSWPTLFEAGAEPSAEEVWADERVVLESMFGDDVTFPTDTSCAVRLASQEGCGIDAPVLLVRTRAVPFFHRRRCIIRRASRPTRRRGSGQPAAYRLSLSPRPRTEYVPRNIVDSTTAHSPGLLFSHHRARPARTTQEVTLPQDTAYPAVPPLISVRCTALSPASLLQLTRACAARAAECAAECGPCVYELTSSLPDALKAATRQSQSQVAMNSQQSSQPGSPAGARRQADSAPAVRARTPHARFGFVEIMSSIRCVRV